MNDNVTVICPAKNEQDNIPLLLEKFDELFEETKRVFEVVVIDDASTDNTYDVLLGLQKKYKFLKVLRNRVSQGKSTVITSGIKCAEGDIIVVMDSDLQYVPADIPSLICDIENDTCDIVSGWRQGSYSKSIGSKIFSTLNRILFGVNLHDTGAFFATKREVLDRMHAFARKDWHRFVFPYASLEGYRIGESKVTLYPRYSGVSKYKGASRLVFAFLDLFSFWLKTVFSNKPMIIFGLLGFMSLGIGVFFGGVYVYSKLVTNITWRFSIVNVTFFLSAGIIFILFGFIADLLVDLKNLLERGKYGK